MAGGCFCGIVVLFIACGVIVSAVRVEAADDVFVGTVGYFQCTAGGANLNESDSTFVDRADWGVAISYVEPAQVQMNQDGSSPGSFEHGGITIVKDLSRSSPRYMDALYQRTTLDNCVIEITGSSPEGQEIVVYTVELTSARVAKIVIQGSGQRILEDITFHAGSLTRTFEDGGVTSQQNLSVPAT
jgi:type VI secretion system Hcp family effector